MKNILILLLIFEISISSSCNKLNCANTVYNFQISGKIYPDKDSIHIGDTIWVEINASTQFIDITSGKIIDYSGAINLGNALSVDIFTGGSISDPGTAYAANKFNYFLLAGNSVNNSFTERIREYLFSENNSKYSFKLAIIPLLKGIYTIAISNAANVYRQSDKCAKASFEINLQNTNQHLYFYQNNRPGYVMSDYERTHMYCFKVY